MTGAMDRLSLNTATVKKLSLPEAVDVAARAGLGAIGPWRDVVADVGLRRAAKVIADAGLRVSSLCRGGFLTAVGADEIASALDDNRAAIDEAATLGTTALIMVVGGLPAGDRDLVGARQRVGVVVDTFHVFWDPGLAAVIARAGEQGRIASYQVCDFNLPIASDALLSRGMMGDGFVDFAAISRWVTDAGYTGDIEVEIFNADIWAAPGDEVVDLMKRRFHELVVPHLGADLAATGG